MMRKPTFWILLLLAGLGGIALTVLLFPHAMPMVDIELTMDRSGALEAAHRLARDRNWPPDGYRQAARFRTDHEVREFIHFEAGGNDVLRQLAEGGLYHPFTWSIRHFQESEVKETLIRFTPQGQPYGFAIQLPEDESGAALPETEARALAETSARTEWSVDLAGYELVETSQEEQPGGRVDHSFVYQRPDQRLGEGRYRLRLVVGGDRLTELTHFVDVPEAFQRRYEEMRSANTALASTGSLLMSLLYGGGGAVGLFLLLRRRWLLWRPALWLGTTVALLQLAAQINSWPLAWMYYDTALSARSFFLMRILQLLSTTLAMGIGLSVIVTVGEGLTRRAFPGQLQLWRSCSGQNRASLAVLGQTVGSYLWTAVELGYIVLFYYLSHRFLGWSSPAGLLQSPDALATRLPWLDPLANSAMAGVMEECLFRAVPLAGAALIGARFGRARLIVGLTLVVQALIFGAGHANYPQQPAYARVVEIFVPFLITGLVYLRFGLLPVILMHFLFDLVVMSLPLFMVEGSGAWFHQVVVVAAGLLPLVILLATRFRAGSWSESPPDLRNAAWAPPEPRGEERAPAEPLRPITARPGWALALGLVGLILWVTAGNFSSPVPKLSITRRLAEETAHREIQRRGHPLPEGWRTLSVVGQAGSRRGARFEQAERYVWENGGPRAYRRLVGSYLAPPTWDVRLVTFRGDVAERAEEYLVQVDGAGRVRRFRHRLPEGRAGADLEEDQARMLAQEVLRERLQQETADLREVESTPSKLPERTDWNLTYVDDDAHDLPAGEARIEIALAGDQGADAYRWFHPPEDWSRLTRDRDTLLFALGSAARTPLLYLVFLVVVAALVSWARGGFPSWVFFRVYPLLVLLALLVEANRWPALKSMLLTSEPISHQLLRLVGGRVVAALFVPSVVTLLIGFSWPRRETGCRPPDRQDLVTGLGLGLLLAGVGAAATGWTTSPIPVQPDLAPLNAWLAPVEAMATGLNRFLWVAGAALALLVGAERLASRGRRWRRLLLPGLALMGFMAGGGSWADTLPRLLLGSTVLAVGLPLTHRLLLRGRPERLLPALAVPAVLEAVRRGILAAHPGAGSGAVLTVLCLTVVTAWWWRGWERSGVA